MTVQLLRFADLQERGIVNSWPQLKRLPAGPGLPARPDAVAEYPRVGRRRNRRVVEIAPGRERPAAARRFSDPTRTPPGRRRAGRLMRARFKRVETRNRSDG